MVDNKEVSLAKKSLIYSLLFIYLGIVMIVMAYFIHTGPKAGESIGLFMAGLVLGTGFTMMGTGVLTIIPFLTNKNA